MLDVFVTLFLHRALVAQMAWREIRSRSQATFGGMLWPLLQPLLLLGVFAFVFGEVMRAKWTRAEGTVDFALMLFCGLIVFNLFADSLQRAPGLVTARTNLVKKVVFPLEILAWVNVAQALFNFVLSLAVLLLFVGLAKGGLPWTVVFLPAVILPVVFAALCASWIVGAAAVFVRDVGQLVAPAVTALLFLSPVFFDLSVVPEGFRTLFALNPLTPSIEQARAAVLDGRVPDLAQLGIGIAVGYVFAWLGLWFFRRARPEFADAL